jgi:CDP-6-deoxy-D-xylo-4-hexulose-3-dehydrase
MNLTLPLMSDNIDRSDINSVIDFLSQDPIPRLTNGEKVIEFEKKWSEWLGVKHSVFVNSGASANELTMLVLILITYPLI